MRQRSLVGAASTGLASDLWPGGPSSAGEPPTVARASGYLRGIEVAGIHCFKGVPFAASPTGQHRLKAPQPPHELADTMHRAWAQFAASGDPGRDAFGAGRFATMRFDATSEVVDDPMTKERKLWSGVR